MSILPKLTTTDGFKRVVVEPTEGSKVTVFSHNFCDKTTWYGDSVQVSQEILSASSNVKYVSVSGSRTWIDVTHNKITKENIIRHIYSASIWVDSALKQENSISSSDGDYSIDYNIGEVTFNASLGAESIVTASYCYENGSTWYIRPDEDTKLRLSEAEVQFSEGIELNDTVSFQLYGKVNDFAPALTPAPYPSGTLIPLGNATEYATMYDYIAESNKSYPPLEPVSSGSWRGFDKRIFIYSWDYNAAIDIYHSMEMEIRVSTKNDNAFTGSYAVVALYGLSTDIILS